MFCRPPKSNDVLKVFIRFRWAPTILLQTSLTFVLGYICVRPCKNPSSQGQETQQGLPGTPTGVPWGVLWILSACASASWKEALAHRVRYVTWMQWKSKSRECGRSVRGGVGVLPPDLRVILAETSFNCCMKRKSSEKLISWGTSCLQDKFFLTMANIYIYIYIYIYSPNSVSLEGFLLGLYSNSTECWDFRWSEVAPGSPR